ncbi:MAG: hypothetical protein LBF67_00840 [Prevotellaceae bacterium]|jgi:hypothetical protein|nr:hypothetical protein [Prevotellaceae bacterium]
MKKNILLVSLIAVFCLGAFLSSCKKEEEAKLPTCKCTAEGGSMTIDLSDDIDDLEDEYGDDFADDVEKGKIKTCDDVEEYFEDEWGGYSVSCKVK